MEVTKQSASNADLTYQESVRNLEEARHLWEREMEVLCKVRTNVYERTGRGINDGARTLCLYAAYYMCI
jgi:hypothetical protein